MTARAAVWGAWTNWFTPFRLNAWATLPAAKPAPFCNAPLLEPAMSWALPSPGYQPTMLAGGWMHAAGVFARRAAAEDQKRQDRGWRQRRSDDLYKT